MFVLQTMKLAVKQPSESMPNILAEEEGDSMQATDMGQTEQDEQLEGEEDDEGKWKHQIGFPA